MPQQIPFVDYLVLDPEPHLVAHECSACGARYFDHRDACAGCSGTAFGDVSIGSTGVVRAFTIVALAAPGIPVPFVAATVDCDGTSVRGNIVNVAPDADHVRLGMKVRLVTQLVGADSQGTEAIGYGYEPLEGA
ncbi:MAG: Zn-ribbon domain-containing OB-fold protein [Acidimicrobiales bacterium]